MGCQLSPDNNQDPQNKGQDQARALGAVSAKLGGLNQHVTSLSTALSLLKSVSSPLES